MSVPGASPNVSDRGAASHPRPVPGKPATPVRILVEHGNHHLRNLGDASMLQVAVRRLRALWPSGRMSVLTHSPQALAALCPSAEPLDADGLRVLSELGYLPGRFRLKSLAGKRADAIDAWWRRRRPGLVDRVATFRARHDRRASQALEELRDAVDSADLLVVCGGGFLTDAFRSQALHVVELLRRFQVRGKPTALTGQGIGPVEDGVLRSSLAAALRGADVIGLREAATGPALLADLGVPAERIIVTGDDAVAIGHERRASAAGGAIGVNLRVASYSGAGSSEIESLRGAVRAFAGDAGADLIGLPISLSSGTSDVAALRELGVDEPPDLGDAAADPVATVAARISRCRIVVAGSYHAGVFALGQGIPVVGLSGSDYYDAKFGGLSGQFPGGCRIVRLDDPSFADSLRRACRELWDAAPSLRPRLLEDARRQVEASEALYRRIGGLRELRPEVAP